MTNSQRSPNILQPSPPELQMSVAYQIAQKQRYRITLEISAFPDFDPHQIDWRKLFELEPNEKVTSYIETLDCPDRW